MWHDSSMCFLSPGSNSYIPTGLFRKRALFWQSCFAGEPYVVATISRILKIIGLFCKRALQKRLYDEKETYNFKEPTSRSHPIFARGSSVEAPAKVCYFVRIFRKGSPYKFTLILRLVAIHWGSSAKESREKNIPLQSCTYSTTWSHTLGLFCERV